MRRRSLFALAVVALAASACRERERGAPPSPARDAGGAARVVSLSPSTTEAMFALGAGSRLVGRSRYCDFPPEAMRLPAVGGWLDPSLEAILALSPDLVIGARGPAGPGLTEKLAERGIATFFPRTESLAEIEAMILGLGARVDAEGAARALVGSIAARREAVARAVAGRKKPRVLLVFGLSPVVAAGPDTFPDELLRLAGAEDAVTAGTGYPTLGIERVIALDPDLVLDAAAGEAHGGARIRPDDPGWRELRAVREGRVTTLLDEALLRPGPRVGEALVTLAKTIHPGLVIP